MNELEIDKNIVNGFKNLSNIISECNVVFDKGLKIKMPDRAIITLANIDIPKERFFKFEKEFKVGVNLEEFIKFFKLAKKSVGFDLEHDKFILRIDNNDTFRILSLNLENGDLPPTDDLEFNGEFEIEYKTLKDILNKSKMVSENIEIEIGLGKVKFSCKGNNDTEYIKEIETETKLKNEAVKSRYGLDYLINILKYDISDKIKIAFSKDYPAKISYGYFTYILAPRVEME